MMLAAALILPQLLAPGAEPPAGVMKLPAPRVQMRVNEASATRSPWLDANGWKIVRSPASKFLYDNATGDAAALSAAEAFTYGANAWISTDPPGAEAFRRMLDFLKQVPPADLSPVADVGVIDDGSHEAGEMMNLLTRLNLLYKIERSPDSKLRVNVRLGSDDYSAKDAQNPSILTHKIRSQLGDDHRSLRIYGSEVVVARLLIGKNQARVFLINYANRPVRGLRVRVIGDYKKGNALIYGADSKIEDWAQQDSGTEFSIPELGMFAVIDLFR